MTWITTSDDCEIYYEDTGRGPTLVFVSGFMGIANIWESTISILNSHYRCIAYDNRGYGRSSKPKDMTCYSIEKHAYDLNCVLEELGVNECILVAHSMGGNICSAFYLKHPQKVRGIIYSGTYVDGKQLRALGQSAEGFIGDNSPSTKVRMYSSFGLSPEVAIEAAKWSPFSYEGNAHALVRFKLGEDISQIAVPTLIIQGDKDVVTPVDPCAVKLQQGIPNSELITFQDTNHFPIQEFPEKGSKIIDDFAKKYL